MAQGGMVSIQVGDLVTTGTRTGVVTYVQRGASDTPLAVTVCVGPSPLDLIHPAPHEVRSVA